MENESKEIMQGKTKCQTEEFGKTKVLIFLKKNIVAARVKFYQLCVNQSQRSVLVILKSSRFNFIFYFAFLLLCFFKQEFLNHLKFDI